VTVRRDLAAIWTVLESNLPEGVDAVGTGYEVVAGELLAGIDGVGRRYLLVPLLPGEAARTDTRGRAVQLVLLEHEGCHYLAVTCLSPELYSVFTQFSRELVTSIDDADSPARAVSEAFERWKALFSDAAERGVIGEERLVGVLGELLTLNALLLNLAPPHLQYWRGPLGEPQDFRTHSRTIEVKATLVREGRVVPISGIEQLEPPPGSMLWLVHHRFERDPGGFNLTDITQDLQGSGASTGELARGLAENGVYLDNLAPYDGRRYRVVESRMYDATALGFPRVTRSSFTGGDSPPGTLRFSYSIDLTNEPPSPLSISDAEQVIQAMAAEASNGMGS
jgi:Putative  PD-(D/E)XK family member, (DUF4420)